MNYLITSLIGIIAVLGSFFPSSNLWDDTLRFGTISFPTSLDSLTNPASTDSVATVSHSGQHSNANDAIEAIQAKMGIGGSTPYSGTVITSTTTGTTVWSPTISITGGTFTRATTTNLLALGSTTLQSFTATNATTSNATTTNLYVSGIASTTDVRANTANLGSLTVGSCVGCSSGTGGIEKASSTASILPNVVATSTPLTTGHRVLIFGQCSITVSNETKTLSLYVKPNSTATSTELSRAVAGDTSETDAVIQVSLTGLYNVAATESHELYIGDPNNSKRQTVCNTNYPSGITYVVLN